MLTCKDCYFFGDKDGIPRCLKLPFPVSGKHRICPDFLTKDTQRPNYCVLANNIDDMAKALIYDTGTDFFIFVPTGYYDRDFNKVFEKAKEWLMEVE